MNILNLGHHFFSFLQCVNFLGEKLSPAVKYNGYIYIILWLKTVLVKIIIYICRILAYVMTKINTTGKNILLSRYMER